ncbi:MAG: mismatch-specific DNA-glycosylase [Dehalococcoidia bacterium]|nr:mismatch-specific DNA-glycosylase [Chloroflexota bacterium]MCZ6865811.1 mismatch-specific DNA-glycosylase [Chloroflexota bacterium]
METLPDYLRDGLDIVLVGINPSQYSVQQGHYFANPRNRFWTAFNRSGLVGHKVSMEQDHTLVDHGIGFTDVVKRPSSQASALKAQDYRQWAPLLKEKLERYQPLVACFHGLMAYSHYLRYAEGIKAKPQLGLQDRSVGRSTVFVVPNPSPANARYSLDVLVNWYCRLKDLRASLKGQ